MITLFKRGVLLTAAVVVWLLPGLVQAQVTAVVVPDSSLHDLTLKSLEHRLEALEHRTVVNFDRNDTSDIHYGMPIYNPGSKAVIRVLRPSDDLIYNMPIYGLQSDREGKEIDVWIYPDKPLGKEKE